MLYGQKRWHGIGRDYGRGSNCNIFDGYARKWIYQKSIFINLNSSNFVELSGKSWY